MHKILVGLVLLVGFLQSETGYAAKHGVFLGINRSDYDFDHANPRGVGGTVGLMTSLLQDAFAGIRFELQQNYLTTSKSDGYLIKGPTTLFGVTLDANFNVKDSRTSIGLGGGVEYLGGLKCSIGTRCPDIPNFTTGALVEVMNVTKPGWLGLLQLWLPLDDMRSRTNMFRLMIGLGYQFGGAKSSR